MSQHLVNILSGIGKTEILVLTSVFICVTHTPPGCQRIIMLYPPPGPGPTLASHVTGSHHHRGGMWLIVDTYQVSSLYLRARS